MAGAEGFEPPSSVLETDSLTVELTPLDSIENFRFEISKLANFKLLRFLVRRVLAALPAKLLHLQTVRRRLPVLRRGVILIFAIRALHVNDFAWHKLKPQILTP